MSFFIIDDCPTRSRFLQKGPQNAGSLARQTAMRRGVRHRLGTSARSHHPDWLTRYSGHGHLPSSAECNDVRSSYILSEECVYIVNVVEARADLNRVR